MPIYHSKIFQHNCLIIFVYFTLFIRLIVIRNAYIEVKSSNLCKIYKSQTNLAIFFNKKHLI